MAALGELVVSLSANTAKFTEGLNKAEYQTQKTFNGIKSTISGVGSALGATFAASVFVNFIKGAVQTADAINDIAKANEVAVSSVLKLSQALSLNGGQADSAGRLFSTLTNKIDEAANGSENTQGAFAKIGISLEDLAKLDSQSLFEKTIQGLSQLEDPLKRNALASDLLGKAVRGVDIQGLASDYSDNSNDFTDAEKAFKDIGVALDQLDKFTTNVSTSLATTFAPALSGSVSIVDDLIFGFDKLEKQIIKTNEAQRKNSAFKPAPTINDKPAAGMFNLGEYGVTPKVREVVDPAVKKAQEEAQKRAKDAAKAAEDLRKKIADEKLKDIQAEINFEIELFELKNKQEVELAEKTQKEISDARERYIEIEQKRANDNFDEAQRLAKETTSEWQSAFEELKNSVDGYSRDMSRSLAQFALGGKMSFADMIDNMLLKLLEFANQKLIFDPLFKSISGVLDAGSAGGSNGGGIGGFLAGVAGSVFGGSSFGSSFNSSGAYTGGYYQDGMPIDGFRANGGSVSAGRNYIVGERGAEMFVPSSNGSIVPNNQIGGGSNVTINVIEAQGTKANVQQQQNPDGSMSISVIVEQLYGVMNRDLQRGSGIAPTLERRYGLNRLAGA